MTRRLLSLAILGAVALAPVAATAQHSMSGGGGRSMGGSRMGGSGFSRSSVRSGPAFASSSSRSFGVRSAGFRSFSPSGRVFVGGRAFPRFRSRFAAFPRCFGCRSRFFFGFGPGFVGAPFYPYYPYYPYDYYPPTPAPVAYSGSYNDDARLSGEVQRLTDEVEDLRDDVRHEQREAEPARQPAPYPSGSMSAHLPSGATFIFRDGRRISVKNYAIAGRTLWVLDEHAARRFSIEDLDREATEKVNADNGIDIRIP